MKIIKPGLLDIIGLCAQARDDERLQYESMTATPWDAEAVAAEYYRRGMNGHMFALLGADDQALVAGGWEPIAPGVWQSWMVGSQAAWDGNWRSITKGCRRIMDELLDAGAHRLQTNVIGSRAGACDWYRKGLKMTREGVLRQFCQNGEDLVLYSRLKGA